MALLPIYNLSCHCQDNNSWKKKRLILGESPFGKITKLVNNNQRHLVCWALNNPGDKLMELLTFGT